MENIEKRYLIELRANTDDRIINGTAIVFGKESVLINNQFTETIKREAITPELIQNSDIKMLWNHNDNEIPLARSNRGAKNSTLQISLTPTGVDFAFKAKNTPAGDEVLQAVRSGDVSACSFAFGVANGGDQWERRSTGKYHRTVSKIAALADFSLVNAPAYEATSCRSLDEFRATEPIPTGDTESISGETETVTSGTTEALSGETETIIEPTIEPVSGETQTSGTTETITPDVLVEAAIEAIVDAVVEVIEPIVEAVVEAVPETEPTPVSGATETIIEVEVVDAVVEVPEPAASGNTETQVAPEAVVETPEPEERKVEIQVEKRYSDYPELLNYYNFYDYVITEFKNA